MIGSAFDLGEEIALRTLEYKIHPAFWTKYDLSAVNLAFSTWEKIKYLNDDASDFNSKIGGLPSNRGGLYLFYANCTIITGITEFPFYIGRAQLSESQNLRKRVKEYFTLYSRNNERPKITRMFRYWGKELYLAYKVLNDNETIIDFEKKIVNSLLLPMNDQIPDQEIRQGVKAFQA